MDREPEVVAGARPAAKCRMLDDLDRAPTVGRPGGFGSRLVRHGAHQSSRVRRQEGTPVGGTGSTSLPGEFGRTVSVRHAHRRRNPRVPDHPPREARTRPGRPSDVYGRQRRVSGLRREEVALLAGISVEYYTRLERGNARGVSDEVLDAVCNALQLDEAERAHLRDLARAANASRPPRSSHSPITCPPEHPTYRGRYR